MPVIPGLRRLRKKNPEFEARLRYIERSCLKKKKKKERKKEIEEKIKILIPYQKRLYQ
jgi:hypothetical protein